MQDGGMIGSTNPNVPIPNGFASYEQPGSSVEIVLVPIPISQSQPMSPMASKSMGGNLPNHYSLNSSKNLYELNRS